jgi:X-X-X-Leu-X-X-Gly heptad repeat protein
MNPQLAQGVKQLQDQVQQLQAQNAQILEDIQEINARLTRA